MGVVVGVLALQGGFALHAKILQKCGVKSIELKKPDQLRKCDALVVPGGESTTLAKLLREENLSEEIIEFSRNRPVMGTCAGLILLSDGVVNHEMETMKLIEISVERNAYGRQTESFIDEVRILTGSSGKRSFEGVFIRAPKIVGIKPGVEVLGIMGEEPVMVRNETILAMTFHPELTNDNRLHSFFIKNFINKVG